MVTVEHNRVNVNYFTNLLVGKYKVNMKNGSIISRSPVFPFSHNLDADRCETIMRFQTSKSGKWHLIFGEKIDG